MNHRTLLNMTIPNLKIRVKIYSNFLLLCLLGLAFIFAFYPVWQKLILTWYNMEEYSHGFFILPISLYIAWTKKDSLIIEKRSSQIISLLFVVLPLLIYNFSVLAGILTLQSVSLVLFIWGSVYYLFGGRVFKELLFPLVFLLFMIPIPSQIYSSITIPLQLFVSKASVGFVKLISITVLREGNVIHLPGHTLEVVQACSGLRSMTSLVTLSAIFGYFTLNTNLLRGVIFAAGVPVAVFVNIIRVVLMIVSFYFFNFDLTKGTLHTVFGIMIFAVALLLIFLVRKGLSRWDKSVV